MFPVILTAMIMSSLASPLHKGSIETDDSLGLKELPVLPDKTVDDSEQPSVSTSTGFHKMPDCLASEPFCGGAMYLYYLRWRNLFVDEWPYVPAEPSCFRDILLLDFYSDADGGKTPPTGTRLPDVGTFNLTFSLPHINSSFSDFNTVSLYHATLYLPLSEALEQNIWIEVTADDIPTDFDLARSPSFPGVVAVADVWPSDEECREQCTHYVTANLTSIIAPLWENKERAIVVTVVLHCEFNGTADSSLPCLNDTIFSQSDVPALLFDYTICGDNSTQNYYLSQLLQ